MSHDPFLKNNPPMLGYLAVINCRLTAGVSGECGTWLEKPPDAESAVGAESPKVWATPELVRCTQC